MQTLQLQQEVNMPKGRLKTALLPSVAQMKVLKEYTSCQFSLCFIRRLFPSFLFKITWNLWFYWKLNKFYNQKWPNKTDYETFMNCIFIVIISTMFFGKLVSPKVVIQNVPILQDLESKKLFLDGSGIATTSTTTTSVCDNGLRMSDDEVVFLKTANSRFGDFYLIFVLFKQLNLHKNCGLQRDSNPVRRSRRRARWSCGNLDGPDLTA